MDIGIILDMAIQECAEGGNGTVSTLTTEKNLHIISTVFPEHEIALYVIPTKDVKKLEKYFEGRDGDEYLVDEFWKNIESFYVGTFEPN